MNIITLQCPDTPEFKALIAGFIGKAGVVITSGPVAVDTPSDRMTIQEMADYLKINYFTARKWVVDQKRITCHRPSGKVKGNITVARKDVEALAAGTLKAKKKPGRKGGEVKII